MTKKAKKSKIETKETVSEPVAAPVQVAPVAPAIPQYIEKDDVILMMDAQSAAEKAALHMHVLEQEVVNAKLRLELQQKDVQEKTVKLNHAHSEFKARNQRLAQVDSALKAKYHVKASAHLSYDSESYQIVR